MGSELNHQFVIDICNLFTSNDTDVPICVFKVPNSLSASKPEAYIPQIVSLGVIHHRRHETEGMQIYKLKMAKKIHTGFGRIQVEELLEGLVKLVPSINACYQMYLTQVEIEIAFIMAIDGLFLFKLLCCHGIAKPVLPNSNILRGLADPADVVLHQDGILRDAMMLENQIPILVLKNILLMESSLPNVNKPGPIVKECLPQLLLGFCKALSPLKVVEKYPNSAALKRAHLLDLLYHLIMLKEAPAEEPETGDDQPEEKESSARSQKRSLDEAFGALASLIFPQEIRKPIELLKGLLELPWSNLDLSSVSNIAPVVEESLVPTASNLCRVGVKFCTAEHISAIGFDRATTSLKLPIIKLSVNSEVILRNLVAFEVMSKSESEPLIFTRYFELMNGIIKSAEDVAVLKNHGILQSESVEDDEVAKMFSGSSKPLRSANALDLDKVIADVNNYYNGLRRVKAYKFIKKCGLTFWHVRKLVAAILLLSLLALQTFYTVYGNSRKASTD